MEPKGLKEWLSRVVAAECPPEGVVAFNVGLFETEEGYCAYLSGATQFDPDDDDWACDEAFSPAERYCPLGRDAAASKDWEALLHEVIETLKAFLASEPGRHSYLAKAKAVTVGFDAGNLVRVR